MNMDERVSVGSDERSIVLRTQVWVGSESVPNPQPPDLPRDGGNASVCGICSGEQWGSGCRSRFWRTGGTGIETDSEEK